MTAHAHDPPALGDRGRSEPVPPGAVQTPSRRPRWLLPGLLVATVVAVLVIAGVLPLSTVLYAGLFGGMILMHVGGHGGHGGHGGPGASGGPRGHGGHDSGASEDENLSRPSGSQDTLR